ncbi:hypothetical protein [Thiohalocapsa sp. ML1]|uniref:hypothetical protein n=1 Tax=Thiohalocapsa sp. ML1 TaxID=1431688 RepID=UPI0007322B6C|nr:hypothetical protein [Thiohalocapsa sp. ML1]
MNTKDISEARDPLLAASVAAMRRAAEQARRQAVMTKTRLVVWRDGQIRYLDPSVPDGAKDAADAADGSAAVHRPTERESP